ncbi:hypothetical protein BDV98DRAFT_607062 [Pterulicium gracile]|uniref:Uncharacterized protein n=1 Tax=Pterulicium gracile TaxID=1884261 RepID=A0A5C3QI52_9AGAR|nr:hypothetical protein BDV98DRAFT_607062 [Pterula gracilis]
MLVLRRATSIVSSSSEPTSTSFPHLNSTKPDLLSTGYRNLSTRDLLLASHPKLSPSQLLLYTINHDAGIYSQRCYSLQGPLYRLRRRLDRPWKPSSGPQGRLRGLWPLRCVWEHQRSGWRRTWRCSGRRPQARCWGGGGWSRWREETSWGGGGGESGLVGEC